MTRQNASGSDVYNLAIASALDCKIFVEARKHRVLSQLENDDLSRRLTTNPNETNLHIVGMGSVNPPVSSQEVKRIFFLLLVIEDVTNPFEQTFFELYESYWNQTDGLDNTAINGWIETLFY